MAKKSKVAKAKRVPKYMSRTEYRCQLCGRPRSYMRFFGLCRICFRNMALKGELPGVTKANT